MMCMLFSCTDEEPWIEDIVIDTDTSQLISFDVLESLVSEPTLKVSWSLRFLERQFHVAAPSLQMMKQYILEAKKHRKRKDAQAFDQSMMELENHFYEMALACRQVQEFVSVLSLEPGQVDVYEAYLRERKEKGFRELIDFDDKVRRDFESRAFDPFWENYRKEILSDWAEITLLFHWARSIVREVRYGALSSEERQKRTSLLWWMAPWYDLISMYQVYNPKPSENILTPRMYAFSGWVNAHYMWVQTSMNLLEASN
ncbi:MAG: hypothetical protein R3A11_01485 [Bdellovibrionota bacterium]